MNRSDFLERAANYANVSATDIAGLQEVLGRYPYFQPARALLVRALKLSDDFSYQEELKDAALHAGDRRLLRTIVESVVLTKIEEEGITEKQPIVSLEPEPEIHPVEKSKTTESLSLIEELPEDGIESIVPSADISLEVLIEQPSIVKDAEILSQILDYPAVSENKEKDFQPIPTAPQAIAEPEKLSFTEWLKRSKIEHRAESTHSKENLKETLDPKPKVVEESLISKFIETDPRISPPTKAAFFSPVDMARKSVEDRDDVVSETLAKIYAAQGDVQRAIRIYNKLSLLYPEKNSYFAALIETLENPS